jgi:hypothetical protein
MRHPIAPDAHNHASVEGQFIRSSPSRARCARSARCRGTATSHGGGSPPPGAGQTCPARARAARSRSRRGRERRVTGCLDVEVVGPEVDHRLEHGPVGVETAQHPVVTEVAGVLPALHRAAVCRCHRRDAVSARPGNHPSRAFTFALSEIRADLSCWSNHRRAPPTAGAPHLHPRLSGVTGAEPVRQVQLIADGGSSASRRRG